jgi:sterol desaturase/sphingolipid hydroxylase (fatty acid hydroxylase superfamily)
VLRPPISLTVLAIHQVIPGGILATLAGWPIWLKACATMAVGETACYWAHRLCHQIPFLWRFHAVHHGAEELDFLVNIQMHPVDLVCSRMVMLTPSLRSASPPLFASAMASLPPRSSSPGRRADFHPLQGAMASRAFAWLMTTLGFHHWRHARAGERRECDSASMFPWLDRIFGTDHLPDAEAYGIDEPTPDSLAGQFVEPLARRGGRGLWPLTPRPRANDPPAGSQDCAA